MSHQTHIIKFSIAGCLVVGMDVGIYSLFINFIPNSIAKGISFICAGVVAYLVNKYWTFEQQSKSNAEIVRFILANIAALGLNVSVNELILRENDGAVLAALAAATFLTAVFSFFVFKYWVFTSS